MLPRILLDTNILCANILQPRGTCARFHELALYGFYTPIYTEVTIAEFINKCRVGMTKKQIAFSGEDIDAFLDAFLDAFAPHMNPENIKRVSIGRGYMLQPHAYKMTLNELLYELTGRTRDDLLEIIHDQTKIYMPSNIDLDDLHVMVGALEHYADFIVTRNLRDFPPQFGRVHVITPESALANFPRVAQSPRSPL